MRVLTNNDDLIDLGANKLSFGACKSSRNRDIAKIDRASRA
jgi:hypothetical protein